MFVSEIFQSIQGEGALTGVPSIFIRTSGCNLRCTWCDTKYASWHPEGEDVPIEKIVSHVIEQRLHHVVLTGGEPMIARGIHELASHLQTAGRHITIETAGTVLPDGIACDLASLSPKLANSTPPADAVGEEWHGRHERSRCQPGVLAAWIDHGPYQLKFVVQGGDDLREIRELLSQIDREIPPWNVLLMPEGVDLSTTEAHAESVVELCKQFGYRYCHRLHLELFGSIRGT